MWTGGHREAHFSSSLLQNMPQWPQFCSEWLWERPEIKSRLLHYMVFREKEAKIFLGQNTEKMNWFPYENEGLAVIEQVKGLNGWIYGIDICEKITLFYKHLQVTFCWLRNLSLGLYFTHIHIYIQQLIMETKVMNLKLRKDGYRKYYGGRKVRGNDIIIL